VSGPNCGGILQKPGVSCDRRGGVTQFSSDIQEFLTPLLADSVGIEVAQFSQGQRDRLTGDADHGLRIAMSPTRCFNRRNEFLEAELETQVSHGYTRGVRHERFKTYSS